MLALKNRIEILKALIFSSIITFIFWPVSALAAVNDVLIDTGAIEQGIVKIAFQSNTPEKVKVMVQKDNQKYIYDLRADGSNQSFPLQMGNGNYKVSVLQNTQGTKYKYLKTEYVALDLADQRALYLNSIQNINWGNGAAADKAKELTYNLDKDKAKVEAIYSYMVDNFSYDYDKKRTVQTGYIPDIDDTLLTKKGICYDHAALFAAMTRSVGIPCKLVKGYAKGVNDYHAWNEVAINGEWIVVDTTSDMQLNAAHKTFTMEKPAECYNKLYEY